MLADAFDEDEEPAAESGTAGADEQPNYTFDGFEVVFSDRVMLTPIEVVPALMPRSAVRNDR